MTSLSELFKKVMVKKKKKKKKWWLDSDYEWPLMVLAIMVNKPIQQVKQSQWMVAKNIQKCGFIMVHTEKSKTMVSGSGFI